eukprot:m.35474 g.35474  ORF g.35474 m.35474 type:complete len:57 (+) comp32123_c0_seq6:1083-1253(+)
MSGIAALMLMYLNEEEAFWALVVLLKDSKYTMHGTPSLWMSLSLSLCQSLKCPSAS